MDETITKLWTTKSRTQDILKNQSHVLNYDFLLKDFACCYQGVSDPMHVADDSSSDEEDEAWRSCGKLGRVLKAQVWWVLRCGKMTVLLERLQTPLQGSDDSIACWWPKAPQMFQQMVGTTIRSFSSYCRDDGYDLHITQDKQKILETHSRNTSPKTCQKRKFRMTALMRGGIYSDDPGRPRRAVFSKFGFACLKHINIAINTITMGWDSHHIPLAATNLPRFVLGSCSMTAVQVSEAWETCSGWKMVGRAPKISSFKRQSQTDRSAMIRSYSEKCCGCLFSPHLKGALRLPWKKNPASYFEDGVLPLMLLSLARTWDQWDPKGSKRVVPAWKIRFFLLSSFFLTLRLEKFFFCFLSRGSFVFFFWHWDVFVFCWVFFF